MTETDRILSLWKAMGDPNRLLILEHLRQGELCACKILEELQIGQPTLSHHMKILLDAELVRGRKEGKWMHYTLVQETFEQINQYIKQFY